MTSGNLCRSYLFLAMAVEVWIGEKPEHPNERKAIIALANGLDRLDGLHLMLANFSVGGNTIDLVIVKSDAIFIIELKHCDGRVFGAVNGQWRAVSDSGYTKLLNPGRKNPYNQVIAYYYSFINFLNANRRAFLSEQKAGTIDFRACRRVVAIAPTLQEGSHVEVDWKVAVKGFDELPTYLVTERTSEINLSEAEMRAIPELLNCQLWQEVNDLVTGVMPDWEEMPVDVSLPSQESNDQPDLPEEVAEDVAPASLPSRLTRWPASLVLIGALALLLLLFVSMRGSAITLDNLPPSIAGSAEDLPTIVGGAQAVSGCNHPVQQAVRKRRDPDTNQWITVDVADPQGETPDVIVTLEWVDFCDGRVVLHWRIQNQSDRMVRMPLTNDNLQILDTTQLIYPIDERASDRSVVYVRRRTTETASVVIPRPINPSASTISVFLKSEPFPATWPVAVPRYTFGSGQ